MRYLTIQEIAKIYRINEDVARRWCQSGKIKAMKIGRKWLIPTDKNNLDEKHE